jgi:hypothetical protein
LFWLLPKLRHGRSLLQAAKLLDQRASARGTGRLLMARFNIRRLSIPTGIKSPGTVCSASAAVSVSSTDPGLSIAGTGYIQGYNAPAAVDGEAQVIVAHTLPDEGIQD